MTTRSDYDTQRKGGATHAEALQAAANSLLTVLQCADGELHELLDVVPNVDGPALVETIHDLRAVAAGIRGLVDVALEHNHPTKDTR